MKGLGIDSIGPVALSIGVAIIIVSVIALILANMSGASTNGNFTYVIGKGLTAIQTFADWFQIIVIVVVAVIILALVMLLRGRGGEG
jgi:hypothetical protein